MQNYHDRIYWYTLHCGYIGWLPEDTYFRNNPIAKNGFTNIRSNFATIGRSQKASI